MEGVAIVHDSAEVARIFLKGITPNAENTNAKITPGIFAADAANELVQEKGIPFRDAYKQVLGVLEGQEVDMEKNLASKKSLGAPGDLQLKKLKVRASKLT